jgi:choline dehydrogenase-like flavoprotein
MPAKYVIEAGPDVSNHPVVPHGMRYTQLLGTEIDWNYKTVPQKHLGGRILLNHAGRAVGGSSAINAGSYETIY